MKIIHTSDWHIGKKLYEKKLDKEHEHFFISLENIIRTEKVDVLIVAGDIFDHAYPSNASLQMYYKTLLSLTKTGLKNIVISGGNHDAISTLEAPKMLLGAMGIHVVAGVCENENHETDYDQEIIKITNDKQEIELVLCVAPFLRDKDIRLAVAGETFIEKNENVKVGIENHFAELAKRTKIYREQGIPVFAVAHLFTSGATSSESEREIYSGNLLKTDSNIFAENFDYTALGHIHRPQIIGGHENVRYSGSPIPLSFSERKDQKNVVYIETHRSKPIKIRTIPLFPLRKLARIKGTFAEVQAKVEKLKTKLTNNDFVEILVEEENSRPDLLLIVQHYIEEISAFEILRYTVKFKNTPTGTNDFFDENTSITEVNDELVFKKLLEKQETKFPDELLSLYQELKESVLAQTKEKQ